MHGGLVHTVEATWEKGLWRLYGTIFIVQGVQEFREFCGVFMNAAAMSLSIRASACALSFLVQKQIIAIVIRNKDDRHGNLGCVREQMIQG